MIGAFLSLIGMRNIVGAASGILRAVFEFLKTPIGQVVAALLMVILAYTAGGVRASVKLKAEHRSQVAAINAAWELRQREASARHEAAQHQRDAEIAKQVEQATEARVSELEAQAFDLNEQVKRYEQSLGKVGDADRITPDDMSRFGGLRAQQRKPGGRAR
jgi:hypothetical protein